MARLLKYETRDGKGNDIIKYIPIKEFKIIECDCNCDICSKQITNGVKIKDAVSGHFTDWSYFENGLICETCSQLFSIYPYSYIVSVGEIELINVRQIRDKIINSDTIKPPFMFCISTSQKKHLFYRARFNYNSGTPFAVNLETETIMTTVERQRILFNFVENLQTLGCTKEMLKRCILSKKIPLDIYTLVFCVLKKELQTSREIQIPLFCGQKRDTNEEETICNLISTLKTFAEQKQL